MERPGDPPPSAGPPPPGRDRGPSPSGRAAAAPVTEKGADAPKVPAGPLPAITLPKGGGAIRGMGEKFSVNAATGTGSMALPIALSPGRAGFGPQLGLTYDSGAGNGPFGLGWSVGLATITRKTDKGLPRYDDAAESDVFILAGAEDLVPLLGTDGQRVRRPRTVHGVAYDVFAYLPRTEGLFSRIERWTETATGVSFWRTISKDGVTTLYGRDDDSRIAAHGDPRRTFSWLLCRTFDGKGNLTTYHYRAEDGAGVDRTRPHEANRTDDTRGTQRYLTGIRYAYEAPWFADWSESGVEPPLPARWHFEVAFDYGDHDSAVPLPERDRDWNVRPDPFSTYRAGFEVRTYRRCRRVLMFHHFETEPGVGLDCLVRSTDFAYSDEAAPTDAHNPVYTFMQAATQKGYRRQGDAYLSRSLPPAEFDYSAAPSPLSSEVRTLDGDSRGILPEGLDGSRHRLVDLDGEGLPGVLVDLNGAWGYRRNRSPAGDDASFGPLEIVATVPAQRGLGGGELSLQDLSGDGRLDVVSLGGPTPGFYERTDERAWAPYRPFATMPQLAWSLPGLKFVDLSGDGHADVLLAQEAGLFTVYPSLGEDGFGAAETVRTPYDEERGPAVVLAEATQSIFLADLSGDGLVDLVRVRNGEVCYWPNLGYGRFGPKVAMDGAPRFDSDDAFDARRVKLADVDGSGPSDLLYVGAAGVTVWFNQSGNAWSAPQRLDVFPDAADPAAVQVTDLLGTGTACLVWSSALPGDAVAPLRYVDLLESVKPHLLVRTRNNLGAETRMRYAPSTRFYVADREAGRPWVTHLPQVVQVVERVETYDWIGRSRFVSRYAYHHGYFDGDEREVRGFGCVEQWDTEEHRDDTDFPDAAAANWDATSWSPPVRTRTWYHTGAFTNAPAVSRQYADEYWTEPALRAPERAADRDALLLPDTVLPAELDPDEVREAYRALKGMALRIEVFADDGSPSAEHPYIVTEQNLTVELRQHRGPNRHAAFFTHPREKIEYHYERDPEDPRVTHELTLEVDAYGNVLRSVKIGYPRRAKPTADAAPDLSPAFRAMLAYDQTRLRVAGTENRFTTPMGDPDVDRDVHRGPMPSETIVAELLGLAPAPESLAPWQDVETHWTTVWNEALDIPYEELPSSDVDGAGPPPTGPSRRIVEHSRTLYRADDLGALLPLGTADPLALPGETYRLALTPGLLTRVLENRVDAATLTEGGYVQLDGAADWWIPSGRVFYSPGDADDAATELAEARAHFYAPRRAIEPFGGVRRVDHDDYDLLPTRLTDPVGNVTAAVNDYRVLQPNALTDPNGNRAAVALDALGLVVANAVMGKTNDSTGDTLDGVIPDLDEAVLLAHLADPLGDAAAVLGGATSRVLYDRFAFQRTRDDASPSAPVIYNIARETHVSDLAPGETARCQHTFAYSDGLEREIQKKAQAEPGPIEPGGAEVIARWTGSGWTIFDNKGHPVRKYEPFFSATHAFEFARQVGVATVTFYDPIGRKVAALHPDDSWEKAIFDSWRQEAWDAADTVRLGDPRVDDQVGDYFRRLLGDAPGAFTSWHDQRIGGAFGDTPAERDAQRDAAQKAEDLAGTPAVTYFDSVGRACVAVANGGDEVRAPTRTALDPEGRPLAVIDARERRALEHVRREIRPAGVGYVAGEDVAGRALYQNGMDGGARRTLPDVAGKPIRSWDARGHTFRVRYDLLRRQTHRFVSMGTAAERLIELSCYGEGIPERNLCGRLYRQLDGGGLMTNERYDFKGNLVENARRLALRYDETPDWTALAAVAGEALEAAAEPLLVPGERFVSLTAYDALDRVVQTVAPHTDAMRPSVVRSSFNEAGLLERIDVWVRRTDAPVGLLEPTTADLHAVTGATYDAHGKRTQLARGDGTVTDYSYDPLTHRLVRLTTVRGDAFASNERVVQDLFYAYDPVGNLTRVRDEADLQNVVLFRNQRVEPSADYTYDAFYRLVRATGREHLGQTGGALNGPAQVDDSDGTRSGILHPGDGNAMATYVETYAYDLVGNLASVLHQVGGSGWSRRYAYAEPSHVVAPEPGNRLSATSLPGDPDGGPYTATYAHDEHGNVARMPHLPLLVWDEEDRLRSTTRQVVNDGTPETTYYVYDANGQRLRKVTNRQAAADMTPAPRLDHLYLGGLEIRRELEGDGATATLERETLVVKAEDGAIVLLETRTVGTDPGLTQLIRQQFANHIGSAMLELDGVGDVITYEEYFPYGSTSYQAVRSQTETPKRYRYTGKERDLETGLYYHGARYYAPWLGRWTSCDPAGSIDGVCLYAYVRGSPTNLHDPTGHQGQRGGALTVSPESQISAQQWVAMINRSTALTPWMKSMFTAQGNRIELRPENFKTVPAGEVVPTWFLQSLRALQAREWHLTTGTTVLNPQASKAGATPSANDRLIGDYDKGDHPTGSGMTMMKGIVTGETIPAESMKAIDKHSMGTRRMMNDKAGQTRSEPDLRRRASPGRPAEGLVVVANRGRDTATTGPIETRSEESILESLFHELAAHAGPASVGAPFEHAVKPGDPPDADITAAAVRAFFGNPRELLFDSVWTKARKSGEAVEKRLKASVQKPSEVWRKAREGP